MDPGFIKGYYRLATAQIERNDLEGALATIRQGLSIDENNTQLTKQLRIVQQQKKVAAAKQLAQGTPTVSNIALDAATTQELQELQTYQRQTTRELTTVQASLMKTRKEHKISQLTSDELLQSVTEDTKCFRSVGKMFVQTSRNEMVQHLQTKMDNTARAEKEMEQKIEYLDRQLKSQQQNIQELLGSAAPSGSPGVSPE